MEDFGFLRVGKLFFFCNEQREPFAEVGELVDFDPDDAAFFVVFFHGFIKDAEFGEGFEVFDDGFVRVVEGFDEVFLVDVLGDALMETEAKDVDACFAAEYGGENLIFFFCFWKKYYIGM